MTEHFGGHRGRNDIDNPDYWLDLRTPGIGGRRATWRVEIGAARILELAPIERALLEHAELDHRAQFGPVLRIQHQTRDVTEYHGAGGNHSRYPQALVAVARGEFRRFLEHESRGITADSPQTGIS